MSELKINSNFPYVITTAGFHIWCFSKFVKLRTFRDNVPYVPRCLRALNCYVSTCLRLLRAYMHTFPHFSRTFVPASLRTFIYFSCLRAFVSYIILCLRALVFRVLTCLKPLTSTFCIKASNQLNAVRRIQKYMGFKEKEVRLDSFVYSKLHYCPLVWHFCSSKPLYKTKKKI